MAKKGNSMIITPVILCGGSGTRLWPLSRQHYPKQFLKLIGQQTLFQQSICRAILLESDEIHINEILIVTNEDHRFLVLEQLNELKLKVATRILLEPEPRNTAPALTLAALAAKESDPDSLLVVTPADHYVKDNNMFIFTMHNGIKAGSSNTIITAGIKPTRPDTGFGYLKFESNGIVKKVISFKEKPELKAAQKMIKNGKYAWNAGIFILHPKTWLDAINQINPNVSISTQSAWKNKNKDQWFERPNEIEFKKSPSDSIDFAVLERVKELKIDLKMIMLDAGWSDLGSFNALNEIHKTDSNGNILSGDVLSVEVKNTIAISTKKNISLLNVQNLIVIETADSILVANRNDSQSIKKLVNALAENHSELLKRHTRVYRPWGWFETLEEGDTFKVKRIQIDPGKSISLQRHKQRSEHWVVVQGVATVIKNNVEMLLNQNESTFIEQNQIHRLSNTADEILQIIEVQSGLYLEEDDIERLEDIYGR